MESDKLFGHNIIMYTENSGESTDKLLEINKSIQQLHWIQAQYTKINRVDVYKKEPVKMFFKWQWQQKH